MGQMKAALRGMLGIALGIAAAGLAWATSPQDPSLRHAAPAPERRVDINHATLEELLRVPGMTKSWAGRIVRFRPYRTKQDLVDRGIVSGEVYSRIKDYIIAHRKDSGL
jgi:DNA uptake protein ComE-like DNA-binding protein